MIALTETGGISLATAFLSASAIVLVAWIGNRQRIHREETHEETERIAAAVAPTNGYATLGENLEAVTTQLSDLNAKVTKALEDAEASRRATDTRIEALEDAATKPAKAIVPGRLTPKPKGPA